MSMNDMLYELSQPKAVEVKKERPKHWAEIDIATRTEKIASLTDKINQIEANPIWSDEGRKQAKAPLVRELSETTNIEPTLTRLEDEFLSLQAKHSDIINGLRLDDPLNNAGAGGVRNSIIEVESLGQQAANFGEFQAQYEKTSDPFIKRAYQLQGASIASQRWPGVPAIGSFKTRLETDRRNLYQSDDSNKILDRAKESYPGIKEVMMFSRRQFRSETGAALFDNRPGSDAPSVRAERLQTTAANYISEHDPSYFDRSGLNGGYYQGE